MKTFVGHESCPGCGSSDNVGVWSDGQKYCFGGCGFFIPGYKGMSIEDIKKQLRYEEEKEKRNAVVALPVDYSLLLRSDAQAWLNKYSITQEEQFKYKIGWSDIYESLVLPCFDIAGNLLISQRRYFGSESFSKYITKGYPESVIWTARPAIADSRPDPHSSYNGSIVIVEDFISAIKVGRQREATPLFGSSLALNKIKQLSDRWEEVVFWLDYNKTKEAMKYRIKSGPYFNSVWVVATEKDPKDYSDADISSYLSAESDS